MKKSMNNAAFLMGVFAIASTTSVSFGADNGLIDSERYKSCTVLIDTITADVTPAAQEELGKWEQRVNSLVPHATLALEQAKKVRSHLSEDNARLIKLARSYQYNPVNLRLPELDRALVDAKRAFDFAGCKAGNGSGRLYYKTNGNYSDEDPDFSKRESQGDWAEGQCRTPRTYWFGSSTTPADLFRSSAFDGAGGEKPYAVLSFCLTFPSDQRESCLSFNIFGGRNSNLDILDAENLDARQLANLLASRRAQQPKTVRERVLERIGYSWQTQDCREIYEANLARGQTRSVSRAAEATTQRKPGTSPGALATRTADKAGSAGKLR